MRRNGKTLYYADNGPITQVDIEQALVDAGLKTGDLVMVHSDVASFGKLGDTKNKKAFLGSLLNAFLNVIGKEGTLIVPTYTYSYCKNETFDKKKTKSAVGVFSEFVRNQPNVLRSKDPIFSHAAIGEEAEKLLGNVSNICFGEDSFFDRLYKKNGKIINFGKFFDITFLHYIERSYGVDYRFNKRFSGTVISEDGASEKIEAIYYVKYLPEDGRNVEYDMTLLGNELEKRGLLKRVWLGNSFILCSHAKDCYNVGIEMLNKNHYAFLKKNPNILTLENEPFYIGVCDSPDNKGFPARFPLTLAFDKAKGLIVQQYSAQTERLLEEVYKKGSLLSTNLGQGSFGVRRADDALQHLSQALSGNIAEKSFLEVGCADGYLLHRLQLMGAREVIGCEPGPMAQKGSKKFDIPIINEFFRQGIVNKKFDVVLNYGVLEHIHDPEEMIALQKQALNEKSMLFVAVPNCEIKLRIGDITILRHEHWNYFTKNSLIQLLRKCGFNVVEACIGMHNAMIYAWGKKCTKSADKAISKESSSEEELFYQFCAKIRKHREVLGKRIEMLELQGKTLGLYGGIFQHIEAIPGNLQPRFFDSDVAKQGKYYPGYEKPIENPNNLLTEKVDELWIVAIDYNDEIIDYLKKDLKISPDIQIFSLKEFLEESNIGRDMYALVEKLFPICRSITGNGVRETLKIVQQQIPIRIHEVPTGTEAFDWTVPKEWNIKDAYVKDEAGNKIIDFKKNNLHVVGYSIPINKTVNLSELQEHLYSLPDQKEAIPYVTSYYQERWGFCISHKERKKLKEGIYNIFIDSELKDGFLTYGELIIPGESDKEVFISTYVCHPSMANNELSGPVVTTFLVKWILNKPRKYTYRIIFIPETIGAIIYLSKNLIAMKKNMIAGFNVTCTGDNRAYSYLPTRNGNSLADKVTLNVLSFKHPNFIQYSFLDRASDERQYNAPGVDLPVCCVMRSKFKAYPEYHTSLDNLNFVSPGGLAGSYEVLKECLKLIEKNRKYKIKCLGEPQFGKRGLYPTISIKYSSNEVKPMMDFIAYADGKNDLIDISNTINVPVWELYPIIEKLMKADLLTS